MGERIEDSLKKDAAPEAPTVAPEAHEEGVEKGITPPEVLKENADHHNYVELGGKINRLDYEDILTWAEIATAPDKALRTQAEHIAETAHIAPIDERVIKLYGVMRTAPAPRAPKPEPGKSGIYGDHYTRMSDQQLSAEALRMTGNAYSATTLISAKEYKHIPFGEGTNQHAPGDTGDAKSEALPRPPIGR